MMTNLFSVCDPTSSFLSNWLSMLTPLLLMVMLFWLIPSRPQFFAKSTVTSLNLEMSLFMGPASISANILVITLFLFVFTNFLGLFPYIFTYFFMICGLHHVNWYFFPQHYFGFEAAGWYWYFVDVIWFFLYLSVYWWGGLVSF